MGIIRRSDLKPKPERPIKVTPAMEERARAQLERNARRIGEGAVGSDKRSDWRRKRPKERDASSACR